MKLVAFTLGALSAVFAGAPAAHACGYHDPSSVNLGMLNWSYPDALYVRTAVWMSQRDGALSRDGLVAASNPAAAPMCVTHRLQAAALKLTVLRDRLVMTAHTGGPASDGVVILTDEPVIDALLDGKLTPQDARLRGLIRFDGVPDGAAGACLHVTDLVRALKVKCDAQRTPD